MHNYSPVVVGAIQVVDLYKKHIPKIHVVNLEEVNFCSYNLCLSV